MVIFWGGEGRDYHVRPVANKSSMTLEDPLNQSECYRILQDIKLRRSPELFFSYLKNGEFSGVGGFLVNICLKDTVIGAFLISNAGHDS